MNTVIDIPVSDAAQSFGDSRCIVHIKSFSFIPDFQQNIVFVLPAGDADLHNRSVIKRTMQHRIFRQRLQNQFRQKVSGQLFIDS